MNANKTILLKRPDGIIYQILQVENYNDGFPTALNAALEIYQNSKRPMSDVLITELRNAGYNVQPTNAIELNVPYPRPTPSDGTPWDTGIIRSIDWTSSGKHPGSNIDTVLLKIILKQHVDPEDPAFRDKNQVYWQLMRGRVRTCPDPDSIISIDVKSKIDKDGDPQITYDITYKKGKPHERSGGAEPTPFWPG